MRTRFKEYMTDEQLAVCELVLTEVEKDYLYCDEQYKRASNARVSLPHTNERGVAVRHGANMDVVAVSDYWLNRRDANKRFLSREFAEKHDINTTCITIC